MTLTKEQLDVELEKVNKEIEKLTNDLINALQTVGIEYLDLYTYINLRDKLITRKSKISYMIAVDLE